MSHASKWQYIKSLYQLWWGSLVLLKRYKVFFIFWKMHICFFHFLKNEDFGVMRFWPDSSDIRSTSPKHIDAATHCELVSAVICLGGIPGQLLPVIGILGWYSDDRQVSGPIMWCFSALWAGVTEGIHLLAVQPTNHYSYPKMVAKTIGFTIQVGLWASGPIGQ